MQMESNQRTCDFGFNNISTGIFDDQSDVDSLLQITSPLFFQDIRTSSQDIEQDYSGKDYNINQMVISHESSGDESQVFINISHNNYDDHGDNNHDYSNDDSISTEESFHLNDSVFQINLNGNIITNSVRNRFKDCTDLSKKSADIRISKKVSDIKYRTKMKEQYDRLSDIIIGKDIKWRKKELLDLAVKYIEKLKKSNQKLMIENMKLKHLLKMNQKETQVSSSHL